MISEQLEIIIQNAFDLARKKKHEFLTLEHLLYELCKDDDGKYLVMELYEDEAAVSEHRSASHIKESGPSFKGLMSGPPIIKKLSVIPRAV